MKTFAAAAVLGLASASPLAKRQNPGGNIDAVILNYALTLEHLENTFYRQGLQNFTAAQFAAAGFPASFYNNLRVIAGDEASHVSFLTQGLQQAGAKPVAECTYKFPYTDPKSFVTLSSILEGVGVSAYLGAAQNITSKAYLTAAGAILTVESRHSAFVRGALGQVPFPTPFDTPLDFNEIFTLAAPFITGCPAATATTSSSLDLPVKAFPSLSVVSSPPVDVPGSYVCFQTAAPLTVNTPYYLHFLNGLQDIPVKAFNPSVGQQACANIPQNVAGQTYVVLTGTNATATDNNIIAGPAIIEVAPCNC